MLSDFAIVSHKFPERPNLKIYPISDVHLGAAEHMEKEWTAFCKRIKDEGAYVILGGDLINNGTRFSLSKPSHALTVKGSSGSGWIGDEVTIVEWKPNSPCDGVI